MRWSQKRKSWENDTVEIVDKDLKAEEPVVQYQPYLKFTRERERERESNRMGGGQNKDPEREK